jgi:photosystem II stability/assembly factor-like uncharacterized protein
LVGGVASGIAGGSQSSAAGQQKTLAPGTAPAPELMSRYSPEKEKASLQAAYQRSIEIRSPDPHVLWRVGGGGFVERSIDGGVTWQGQLPVADAHLVAGAALSGKICWLTGRDGIILLTTDGTKWTTIPPPVHADFVDIAAADDSSATVTTADGRKFTTRDAGKKWQPAK